MPASRPAVSTAVIGTSPPGRQQPSRSARASADRLRTDRSRRVLPAWRRAAGVLAVVGALAVAVAGAVPAAALPAGGSAALPAGGSAALASTPAPPPRVPAPGGEHPLERRDVDAWLDGLVPAALEGSGIAGAVVAVVHDGEVVTTRGYGWADTATTGGEPVPVEAERTLFRPGSVSKLFTATAVLQLVERGEVDLDTDVSEYVDIDVPRRFDTPVTLRHLLTHTAGFEERVGGLIGTGEVAQPLRDALAQDPPEQVYEPGTVPAYSNYGNALAGYVVERVSGVPFEDFVRQNIFEPAGMTSSTFEQPLPEELRDRMSQGYPSSSEAARPFELVGTAPAGALTSSAPDMARFMLAQLGEPGAGTLLGRETLDLLHAPALTADTLGTLAQAPRMTLGFFDESRNGHRILGHGGDTQYFHAHLQLYPDDRTGVFVAVNSSGSTPAATLTLRESVLHGFTDRYFPGEPAPTAPQPTAQEHAALAAGSYVSSRGMHSTFLAALDVVGATQVTARPGGRLLFTPGPNAAAPALYEEVAPWVWREVGGQRTLAMRVEDGAVQAIAFEGAFALLPAEPERSAGLVLPVAGASVLVLLGAVLAWPVGAVRRRARRRAGAPVAPAGRADRVGRGLTRVAAFAAVVATVGWVFLIGAVMSLQPVPQEAARVTQVLQGIGVLGLVPAAAQVVSAVRGRRGWRRVLGALLVLLALGALAWLAVELRLLAPSVSY
ncbi:serine hydrolase domain-containing protein [Promicromonospora citrea]|uniref:serine hydrolase domain-containing protein n=2 Tax=Promicromonospora citrea TaxID=43677 RepID=UPI001669E3A7|nr:serine hydrolase domain-containing protein [Promicromonospora citrea]